MLLTNESPTLTNTIPGCDTGIPELYPSSVLLAQDGIAKLIENISGLGEGQGGVIETMTMGGDETGLNVATAILDAVESGAKFDLFKCKRGGAFDGGESTTDGFFPLDSSQRLRAGMLRRFYNNTPLELSNKVEREIVIVREQLLRHPNFFLHNKAYFEHGKLGMGYDMKSGEPLWATVGGASIRNEWSGIGEEQYIDSMVYLQHPWMREMLSEALMGDNQGWKDGFIILTQDNYTQTLDELLDEDGELRSSVAYLGLSERIRSLESTQLELFVSKQANVNRWRNMHFLHELFRRINKGFTGGLRGQKGFVALLKYWRDFCCMPVEHIPDSVKIILLDQVLHMKSVCKGPMVITGSGNLVEGGYGELGVGMKEGECSKVDQMISENHAILDTVFEVRQNNTEELCIGMNTIKSELSDSEKLEFGLLMSQIEHAIMWGESFLTRTIYKPGIRKRQGERQQFYQGVFGGTKY